MDNRDIGNRMRMARENANIRQIDVKNRSPINNKNLSNWEKGVSQPSVQDAIILADLYEVTLDELFGHVPVSISGVVSLTNTEKRLIIKVRRLNDEGRIKVFEYVEDVSGNARFLEKEAIVSA